MTVGSDQEEGGRFPYAGTAGAIQKMGAKHVKKKRQNILLKIGDDKVLMVSVCRCYGPSLNIAEGELGRLMQGEGWHNVCRFIVVVWLVDIHLGRSRQTVHSLSV